MKRLLLALLLDASLHGTPPARIAYTAPPVRFPFAALTTTGGHCPYFLSGTSVEEDEVVRSSELYAGLRLTW